jgi:hypothetical protein
MTHTAVFYIKYKFKYKIEPCQVQWLKSVIQATQEEDTRRIMVQGQPRQKVSETPSQPVKAGYGSICPWSQLCRRQR